MTFSPQTFIQRPIDEVIDIRHLSPATLDKMETEEIVGEHQIF